MNSKSVSVVMTTYKHEHLIRQAVEGVLMQQCDFDVELILADDCSPDNTQTVIKNLIDNHPKGSRIKYTRHLQNKGMIKNFIWAYGQCSGKYVALCEGDDYWTDPLKLQKQIDFLDDNPEFSFCFHDAVILVENTGKESLRIGDYKIDETPDLNSVIIQNNVATASLLFRRDALKEFPDWYYQTDKDDYSIVVLLAESGLGKYMHEAMSVYRVHDGGVWSGINDPLYFIDQDLKFYDLLNDYFKDPNIRNSILSKKNKVQRDYGLHQIREGKIINGMFRYLRYYDFPKDNRLTNSVRGVLGPLKIGLKKIIKVRNT